MKLPEQILEHLEAEPRLVTVTAKELLHLGKRPAIDQALCRLTKRGELIRVSRGVYARPVRSRFGVRGPRVEEWLRDYEYRTGHVVVRSGASAANTLGLTTQNPVMRVYLTSGPSRRLVVGGETIELQHAPPRLLRAPKSQAGHALRALAWLGPHEASGALKHLQQTLSRAEMNELVSLRSNAPEWLARGLGAAA